MSPRNNEERVATDDTVDAASVAPPPDAASPEAGLPSEPTVLRDIEREGTLAAEGQTQSELGPLRRGESVGRLTILRKLGAGGMGFVYLAYDPDLDRKVALKLLRRENGETTRTRLYREAQALAKLAHPNIVAVHDVGTHHGQTWVSMEFIEGQTLDAWRCLSMTLRHSSVAFSEGSFSRG